MIPRIHATTALHTHVTGIHTSLCSGRKMKARNLRKLRISLGLTVGGCAEQMGLTRQTIVNIESGKTTKESSLKYYEMYLKEVRRKQQSQ